MSTILSIDTTSRDCSISVCEDKKIVSEYRLSSGIPLSSSLIPSIDFILKNLNLSFDNIDIFGICIGPGLFTGVRIGLSTLKGMLAGKEKPVIPVTSLEAWAFKRRDKEGNIVPLIDGRRGEVYMSEYNGSSSSGLLIEVLPPMLTNVDLISDFLPQEKRYIFTGSGVLKYKEKISRNYESSVFESDKPFLSYEISQIALLKYNSGVYLNNSNDLLPLYIRKPDAEKNFK